MDVEINKWDSASENGQFVPVHRTTLRNKINGVWISSARQVITADGPRIMGLLIYFIITVNIHCEVHSEIIRYPVAVAVGIEHPH